MYLNVLLQFPREKIPIFIGLGKSSIDIFSVDFGLRETSAAFNGPGKLHGRSVRWLLDLGMGVGQVRTKIGHDVCYCHSGEQGSLQP